MVDDWENGSLHSALKLYFAIINNLNERINRKNNCCRRHYTRAGQTALETIAGYVKEKFPMMGGAVDQLFKAN